MFKFLYFHNYSNKNLGPTWACYQEWNNLGVRSMVAKIRLSLTKNIIFTTVVVSLLTIKYRFSDSGVKPNFWLAKFLTSRHVRMHRLIFCISNTLRKLMI